MAATQSRASRVAIVGASARAAAFSALRAGFDVVAADLFADEDLRRACPATRIDSYPAGFAGWLAGQEVDGWLYTGALENHPDLIDQMATIRPLWGNHGQPLREARDPLLLQSSCAALGIDFPETIAAAPEFAAAGDWLVKTYRGSSGMGVEQVTGRASLHRAVANRAVLQRVAAGAPTAAIYCVEQTSAVLLGVTEQLVGRPEFAAAPWTYCGSIASPAPPSRAIAQQLERIGQLLLGFRLRGIVGVDLLLDEQRAWLIEINPRYTASVEVVDSRLERPAMWQHVESLRSVPRKAEDHSGTVQPAAARAEAVCAKAILFARSSHTVSGSFSQWAIEQAGLGLLADVPAEGTRIEQGHPVLTLLHRGDPTTASARLAERASTIQQRCQHHDERP